MSKTFNVSNTPKNIADFDKDKIKDGRYTMHSIDINGTDGKVHFTGGPYYGPYGITGKTNENATDESNRTANINPNYHKDTNNHFGNNAKGLCLSCHQRTAGATVPSGEAGAGNFMELCSTQLVVSTGDDSGHNDSDSSPKCQKCHMERIQGVLLHKWADPEGRWTQADLAGHLTPEFDAADTTVTAGQNPVRDGWYNSHGFLGANKVGHKTSAKAKIQSGFDAEVTTATSADGTTLTVTTTITNKTAHVFPGAHPMRRVLTRMIVRDGNGTALDVVSATGNSTFGDIVNYVQPLDGKVLHASALNGGKVPVNDNGSKDISFPAKTPDLDGSAVSSQKFSGEVITINGTDTTILNQEVNSSGTFGTVSNAAVVDSTDVSNFTRVYGRETGKKYDGTFVVRPGFDSNMVAKDSRLSPNETETYTTTYDISGKSGVSTTYKVYYMQKGANGKFIVDPETGFLDQTASDAKKLLVTEVGSITVSE